MAFIVFVAVLVLVAFAAARWGVDSRDPRYSVGALLDDSARTDDGSLQ